MERNFTIREFVESGETTILTTDDIFPVMRTTRITLSGPQQRSQTKQYFFFEKNSFLFLVYFPCLLLTNNKRNPLTSTDPLRRKLQLDFILWTCIEDINFYELILMDKYDVLLKEKQQNLNIKLDNNDHVLT